MFAPDGARTLAGGFLKGPLTQVIDCAGNAASDAQEQLLGLGIEDILMQPDLH